MNKQGKNGIGWCDMTWNPVTGCLHGCDYCYAKRIANRFGVNEEQKAAVTAVEKLWEEEFKEKCSEVAPGIHEIENPHYFSGRMQPYPYNFQPTFHRYRLDEPKRKTKGAKLFVSSMGDLFGEWVPSTWICDVLNVAEECPQHTFLFLTKNPKRYKEFKFPWNCWLGTTIENQEKATARMSSLVASGHRKVFLSIEPLTGPIDIPDVLIKKLDWGEGPYEWPDNCSIIGWVIIGAQTGPRAVPPKPEWVQSIIGQARDANVPVFLKNNLDWLKKVQEFPKL